MLFLSQKGYLLKVLESFGMKDCKSVTGPLAQHFKLTTSQCLKTDEDMAHMSSVPYANGVGSLMYAMICTRLDLAYSVSLVSRFMENLGREH